MAISTGPPDSGRDGIIRGGMGSRMLESRRPWPVRRVVPLAIAAAVLTIGMIATGCESTPMRAYRGAQHYSAGTDALSRSDGAFAVSELEQAAVLVPHASEIQNHLGLAYWADGRQDAARVAFEKAIELDCENLAAQTNFDRLVASRNVTDDSENSDVDPKIQQRERMGQNGE
jgi:Tfp pilus assembly protein PilF